MAEIKTAPQIEYTQMNKFLVFIDHIKQMASEYDYVCARERRCFNLVARFLPEVDMISTRALTLKYAEIADYYRENGRFPRILILDDLMIHGRGIAKLLQQLEDMLVIKLLDMGVLKKSENYRYMVYRDLADAVTIYVYARNAGVIFLADGYQEKIRAVKKLYADEMRDLSLQLSRKMGQWDIANTSYVYSIRSEVITDCLLAQKDGRIGSSDWVRKTWSYGSEAMVLYVRLHGRKSVNRIDTIRFFPGRCSDKQPWRDPLPLLTSFSFFGDLQESTLRILFEKVSSILKEAGLNNLADILKEEPNDQINFVLLQTQIQLISFILSVAMLLDFCIDVIPQDRFDDIMMQGDIWKISRNFGRLADIRPELMQLRKKALRNKLKDTILRVIDVEAEELIQVNPLDALERLESNCNPTRTHMAFVNNEVRRAIYHVGMTSEKKAYEQSAHPYRFMPEEYQEHPGRDGVISLRELAEKKQFGSCAESVFSYLASFVAMMDSCAVSVRTKSMLGRNGERKVCTLAKAGEMASFYLPEKVAMFVPVFAVLELNTFDTPSARKRNLEHYLNKLIKGYFSQDCERLSKVLGDEKQVAAVKKAAYDALDLQQKDGTIIPSDEFMREIDMFYDGGHSFYGWNFRNLTAMLDRLDGNAYQGIMKLRKHLIDEIEEMYSFILPPED